MSATRSANGYYWLLVTELEKVYIRTRSDAELYGIIHQSMGGMWVDADE